VEQATTKATSTNFDAFRNIPISTWEVGLRNAMLASRVPGGLEAGGRRSRTARVPSVIFESVVRIVRVKEFGKNRENRHGIRVVEPFTLDSSQRFTRISGKGARRLMLMSQLDRSQSLVICDPLYCVVGTPVWIWAAEFSPVSFLTAFGRFAVSRV
jgi:hypothetical protein